MLESPHDRTNPNADDYTTEITLRMSTAWKTARAKIKEAQKKQKCQHDKKAKDPQVFEGDRVLVYSPAERSGKAYKFACPFKGPYRVVKMLPSVAELSLVGEPTGPTIRVALNHLRRCPKEIVDGPAEEDVLEESEDQMDVEKDPSEDLEATQEEQRECVVEVESAQPSVRRSIRLAAGNCRDATTKDGNI